jgi:hypothetical protein
MGMKNLDLRARILAKNDESLIYKIRNCKNNVLKHQLESHPRLMVKKTLKFNQKYKKYNQIEKFL